MDEASADRRVGGTAIQTERLRLVACTLPLLAAIVRDPRTLESMLGIVVPQGWPEFPQAYPHAYDMLQADPALLGWWSYLFISRDGKLLVGSGGFKGRPDVDGAVEIGYEIAPSLRNRGYATEATRGMVRYAFADPDVACVDAHTLPEASASTRVLEKAGLRHVAVVHDKDDGEIWLWSISRQQFNRL